MIGQSGWDFMDTVLDYNISVTKTNAIIENASASSEELADRPDYFTAMKAYEDLVALNRAESKVIFHPLINSYGFCEPPHYGIMGQTAARRELLDFIGSTCLIGAGEEIKADAKRVAPLLLPRPPVQAFNASEAVVQKVDIVINNTYNLAEASNDQYSCCAFGQCSFFGIERVGGICWEWGGLGILGSVFVFWLFWRISR
jgi:hypothetical protein